MARPSANTLPLAAGEGARLAVEVFLNAKCLGGLMHFAVDFSARRFAQHEPNAIFL